MGGLGFSSGLWVDYTKIPKYTIFYILKGTRGFRVGVWACCLADSSSKAGIPFEARAVEMVVSINGGLPQYGPKIL